MRKFYFKTLPKIVPREDGTYVLCNTKGKERITLPKTAFTALIEKHESILHDLANENLTRTVYWSDFGITIFSMKKWVPRRSKYLCIKKGTIEIFFDVAVCDTLVWMIKIFVFQEKQSSLGVARYDLATVKSMKFDILENRFTIEDQGYDTVAKLSLADLGKLRKRFFKIRDDLRDESLTEKVYWSNEKRVIKSVRYPRDWQTGTAYYNALVFQNLQLRGQPRVAIRERTYRYMLRYATGERLPDETELSNNEIGWKNLTQKKNIDFSDDCEHFKLTNEHGESFILPVAALDALTEREEEIMKDLRAENCEGGPVYWSNIEYAVITDYFPTANRVYHRVLQFIRIKDFGFMLVITDETFKKMLNMYKEELKNFS